MTIPAHSEIDIETIAGESDKFAVAVVLLHGFWETAAVWRPFMGYLAHRGWVCHAVNLPRHPGTTWRVWLDVVEQTLRAQAAPPVVVAHDAGAWLALAHRQRTSAAALLAPSPVPSSLLLERYPWWQRWAAQRAESLPIPRGSRAVDYFGAELPPGLSEERSSVVRSFALPMPQANVARPPAVLFGGEQDRITPVAEARRIARDMDCELHLVDAGHALPWDAKWQTRVGEVHRWLIQRLGDPLLLLRDDE